MIDHHDLSSGLTSQENASFLTLNTIKVSIIRENRPDESTLLRSTVPLEPHPYKITERLVHWANVSPDRIFLGQRLRDFPNNDKWETLTYTDVLRKVRSIAQALLNRKLSCERPVVILSENSIEHALVGLAAMHTGIPYSPVGPAFSLRSLDFEMLKHIFRLLTPGLIFVNNAQKYEHALMAVAGDVEVVSLVKPSASFHFTFLDDLLATQPTEAVDDAYDAIQRDTIAKILFTSGSTGLPKGVINTHENLTTNLQQITQTFPFFRDDDLEFVDWLPWNHTYGGNHNFGIALFNGGSFYIDDGNPTPEGIRRTVENLKDRRPTTYFNVPKGFEAVIPFLKNDPNFCRQFFSHLKMFFYAGAGMPQHVWNALEQLSVETIGKKLLIGTGLGCTESCPSALFASETGGFAGLVGVPVPGLEVKLVPREGKFEARYRGKNIFPGYWRQPDLTTKAFDEEGFYCTGDALLFADERDRCKGMIFNGRLSEDFKLDTGTWVSVGRLRAKLIAEGNGLIQDAVITGHDNGFVGAIVFPDINYCIHKFALKKDVIHAEIAGHPEILKSLRDILGRLVEKSTGSSTFVRRALLADFTLSIDKGEMTDKSSINQRMILRNHPDVVAKIYEGNARDGVVEVLGPY